MASCTQQISPQYYQNDFEQNIDRKIDKNSQNQPQQNTAPKVTVHQNVSSTSIEEMKDFNHPNLEDQDLQKLEHNQGQKSKQQKSCPNEKLFNQNTKNANISRTSINGEDQYPQFQVVVHKVSSKQSLHEDNDQFQIQFTKSQLQIPLDVDEEENQPIKQEEQYVNIWKKNQSQEDDDLYVKLLQEKWSRKESTVSCTEKQQSQEKQTQSFGLVNILKQLSKITNQTNLTPKKQEPHKKIQFKIKKLKQQHNRSSCSTLNVNSIKRTQLNRVSSNKSQFVNAKKQKTLNPINRFSKKHLSNFQSVNNSPTKPKVSARTKKENIQYEIVVGNKLERMNQILQDRSYNISVGQTIKQNHHPIQNLHQPKLEEIKNSQMPMKTVRKVIKRSPYGILQIEVKDLKSHAKITNLRILKPQQMLKLKKIPKIVKNFKQNLCE